MKVGFSYQPVKELQLNVDLYKDVNYKPTLKAGIEYVLSEKFFLRTGVNADPFKGFFGIGILLHRLTIDYALSSHQILGISHHASVSFLIMNKDEK
jgi:hypothetical protein